MLGEAVEAVVEAVEGPLGVGGLELNLSKNVFSRFARRSFPAAPPPLLWKPVISFIPLQTSLVLLSSSLCSSFLLKLSLLSDAALELPLYPFEFCSVP